MIRYVDERHAAAARKAIANVPRVPLPPPFLVVDEPKRTASAYATYLTSAHWRTLRMSIIAKRGAKCEVCNAALRSPQLHHLSYERLGKELDTDIIVACDDCHRGYHGIPTLAAMRERFRIEHGVEKCAPGTAQGIPARGRGRVVARSRGSS